MKKLFILITIFAALYFWLCSEINPAKATRHTSNPIATDGVTTSRLKGSPALVNEK